MGESIGSMLTDLGALRTQLMAPNARTTTGRSGASSDSFAAQLDASFRARAEQLGLKLPAGAAAPMAPGALVEAGDDVDAIWKRVQLQAAALYGPGDAVMKAVGDAADARWEQRRNRGGNDLFDM